MGNQMSRSERCALAIQHMPSVQRSLARWIDAKTELRVMVTGCRGSGVSGVVDSLCGDHVSVSTESDSESAKVHQQALPTMSARLTVWDMQGPDERTNKFSERSIEVINEHSTQMDVFIFCVNVTAPRFLEGDLVIEVLKQLYRLRRDVFKNFMIVLTFAGELTSLNTTQKPMSTFYMNKYREWNLALRKTLNQEVGLSNEIVKHIPIVPVGKMDKPCLLVPLSESVSENSSGHASDEYEWMTDVWLNALYVSKPSGQLALLKIIKQLIHQTEPTVNFFNREEAVRLIVKKQQQLIMSKCAEFSRSREIGQLIGSIVWDNMIIYKDSRHNIAKPDCSSYNCRKC